jgi:glycosyltransferase involved in cell wall biosynthesis
MTTRNETTAPHPATPARPDDLGARTGRPLTVAMATRRAVREAGGVERVVGGLLDVLPRTRPGWRVETVSAFREGSRLEGLDGLADVVASLRLGWRLRRSAADVVFVHCPECLWGIRLLRRRRGGPALIAVWHGAGPAAYLRLRRPGHPMARALAWMRTAGERHAMAADGHVAVHRQVAGWLRSLYGLTAPVTVIENAVDAGLIERLSRLSRRQGNGQGLTAVWAGQTGYRKGLDVALAAVAQARDDLPGLRLKVVGVPAGRPAAGVDWLGVIAPAAMADIYHEADLLLFPTRYDSFGLVVIEAMAAGLPVIVSDAVADGIVKDGRNGVVIAGHDPSDYARALRRLADPGLRALMAGANREDAGRFSVESAVARYAAVAEEFAATQ